MRAVVLPIAVGALLVGSCAPDAPMPEPPIRSTTPTPDAIEPTTSPFPLTTAIADTTVAPSSTSTVPSPPTTRAPRLIVTDPVSGAVVATETYLFRGVTDPGCAVLAAGRYPAEVDAAGTWSIVLTLSPGSNVASFAAFAPAGATTEVQVPLYYVPDPINLGLAAEWISELADGVAVGVGEAAQGSDLNGDGDQEDVLVHVATGDRVFDTGIEAMWGVAALRDGGFLLSVYEEEVNRDLNGDGDQRDAVTHAWDPGRGLVNSGLAGTAEAGSDGSVWIEVRESSQGRDLNKDGDRQDTVVHRWHPSGGVENTGWTATQVHPRADGTVLLVVNESEEQDNLNGDGQIGGHVALWWRGSDDATVISERAYMLLPTADGGAAISFSEGGMNPPWGNWNLRFWHPERTAFDVHHSSVCHRVTPDGGAFFRVPEQSDFRSYDDSCENGTDRNGDGDCGDFILHRWSPATGLFDTGLAVGGWCPECSCYYTLVGNDAFVPVSEPTDGAGHLPFENAPVLHVVRNGQIRNLGLPVAWDLDRAGAVGEAAVLPVAEAETDDLNGDGDTSDFVFHHVTLDGASTNLALAGSRALPLSSGRVLLLAEETAQGADLNGDGRITPDTLVAHLWRSGAPPVNLGITAAHYEDEMTGGHPYRIVEVPGTDRVVMLVPEDLHGNQDLNGDGDAHDVVAYLVSIS